MDPEFVSNGAAWKAQLAYRSKEFYVTRSAKMPPWIRIPSVATVAPESRQKPSHARILQGYRNEREADLFHKKVRATNV